jgi:DedD protein
VTTPAVKPEPKPEPPPKQESKADSSKSAQTNTIRSDDGARALALLEGRPTESNRASNTTATKQPTKVNFVVQALSLDAAADAQSQRDKLAASGISNAFVDGPVVVNGMKKFRVRVGPFPSREAAQAAQTRLRTLGFGGAFIAAQ